MKEEFYIGNFKVMRDDRNCSIWYIPRENTKKKRINKKKIIDEFVNSENFKIIDEYISRPYIETIKELDSNWEDLKKWLEKKKADSELCYYLDRWATYDDVLNKMIGLEGRDK